MPTFETPNRSNFVHDLQLIEDIGRFSCPQSQEMFGPNMSIYEASRHDLRRTASRITFRFQTNDVLVYCFEGVVNRMRSAVVRACGELVGGI